MYFLKYKNDVGQTNMANINRTYAKNTNIKKKKKRFNKKKRLNLPRQDFDELSCFAGRICFLSCASGHCDTVCKMFDGLFDVRLLIANSGAVIKKIKYAIFEATFNPFPFIGTHYLCRNILRQTDYKQHSHFRCKFYFSSSWPVIFQ